MAYLGYMNTKKSKMAYYTPREAFADLIDKVLGKGIWLNNPYVFLLFI